MIAEDLGLLLWGYWAMGKKWARRHQATRTIARIALIASAVKHAGKHIQVVYINSVIHEMIYRRKCIIWSQNVLVKSVKTRVCVVNSFE